MSEPSTSAPHALPALTPDPPAWLSSLVEPARLETPMPEPGVAVRINTGDHFTHIHVEVAEAHSLAPDALADHVKRAYLFVADTLRAQKRHPVRFWNFVPHIHTPSGEGIDRYMVFNSGRFAACEQWHGSAQGFDHALAAASGVGTTGAALAIHCLAADSPGQPVENPRQVPAYKYSQRYGPRPPCFARATRVTRQIDDAWWLLVAGTASIRGEDTAFVGDLEGQTTETFANLDALLDTAETVHRQAGAEATTRPSRFTSLRVYVVHERDLATVRQMVAARYPDVRDVEYLQADLCRADLLVEIEGVAEL